MGKLLVAIAVIVGAVTGCTTAAQQQAQMMRTNAQDANQKFLACVTDVYYSPDYSILRSHIPFKSDDATLEQLTDTHQATDEEIAALLVIHPRMQACRTAYHDQLSKTVPTISLIFISLWQKTDSSVIDLIQRKQSWGEHERRVKEASIETRRETSTEGQRIDAGLNQAHQAEITQRQAAANAFAQYLQNQQAINAMNRPVVTNCNQFGNTVNCVSR